MLHRLFLSQAVLEKFRHVGWVLVASFLVESMQILQMCPASLLMIPLDSVAPGKLMQDLSHKT
jgi:hypothetical protein